MRDKRCTFLCPLSHSAHAQHIHTHTHVCLYTHACMHRHPHWHLPTYHLYTSTLVPCNVAGGFVLIPA